MGHWQTEVIWQILLLHSLCRRTSVNAPANRQMPIASVVVCNIGVKYWTNAYTNIN